jgi:GNAT superfamily N-acetyltransferase
VTVKFLSGEGEMLSIAYLADHPNYLSLVANWVYGEWGHDNPALTLQDYEAIFRNHLVRDTIPLTVIAIWDDIPVGTASIYIQDMSIHPELSPWLAAVYVPVYQRNKGIGSKLVGAIEEIVRSLNIARLYLWTPDKEQFYSQLGWSVIERPVHLHQKVVLMTKTILPG